MLPIVLLVATLGLSLAMPMKEAQNRLDYPEENDGYFEGDIELMPGQDPRNRLAQRTRLYRWPNGVIPYVIDTKHYSTSEVRTINLAIQTLHDKTMVNGKECLKFVPRTNEAGYLHYQGGSGCHTPIGFHNRESRVTLGVGCGRIGTIMHETMHALGFWHEQSRPDRDNYVTIAWNNIRKSHAHNFDKYTTTQTDMLGLKYDYESVMHYNAYSFAIDRRKPTIIVKQAGHVIGQRTHLSPSDVRELQLYYGCTTTSGTATTHAPAVTGVPVGGDKCTFQSGFCTWSNIGGDSTNWIRHHGSTPSLRTGPSTDHSGSSTGYYAYLEASGHSNQVGYLISRTYPPGYYCFSMYYHMHGHDEGKLKVETVHAGGRKPIHTVSGDQGNRWHHYTFTLHSQHENFQFEIEGDVGRSYLSDIAIDDLSVIPGKCP